MLGGFSWPNAQFTLQQLCSSAVDLDAADWGSKNAVVDVGRITMLMSYVYTNPATWPPWLLQQLVTAACRGLQDDILRIGGPNPAAAVMFEPTSVSNKTKQRGCADAFGTVSALLSAVHTYVKQSGDPQRGQSVRLPVFLKMLPEMTADAGKLCCSSSFWRQQQVRLAVELW